MILHNIHYAKSRRRRRIWYISPEGFRELRHSCFLSRLRAAEYLGVSVRTIRHWDAGRNRVPWSAVRLLRLVRAGELGGFDDAWEGWTINRHGLRSPCGRVYTVQNLRHWWLVIEQARFWRQGYEAATRPSAGESVPDPVPVADGDTLLIAMPGQSADTLPALMAVPASVHPRQTAFPDLVSDTAPGHLGGEADAVPGVRVVSDSACACAVGTAQWTGMAVSAAIGCNLPRDVILTSVCNQKWDFTPVGLHQSPPLGPDTNRGQKHPYGPQT